MEQPAVSKKLQIIDREVEIWGEGNFMTHVPEGPYEEDIFWVFRRFLSPTSRCVDIGANFGLTTIALSRSCHAGSILGLEASEATFDYLERNIASAKVDNVHLRKGLVGKTGNRKIFWSNPIEPGSSPSSSIETYDEIDGHGLQATELEAASLDRILKDEWLSDKVDFIKIDCEGSDLEILENAPNTLSHKPLVLMEFNAHCLMNFANINPPEALRRVKKLFPFVYRVGDQRIEPITDNYHFMTQHVHKRHCVDNLLCSFREIAEVDHSDVRQLVST